MTRKGARLSTVPSWIPLVVSFAMASFIISRGLDLLDPNGNSAHYLTGLRVLGFQRWGVTLVTLGVLLFAASILRTKGRFAPLFIAHMGCVFVYGVLVAIVATEGTSWIWARALINLVAAASIHVARAVSLFFERLTEGEVTNRG